jgi:hypothetical protein
VASVVVVVLADKATAGLAVLEGIHPPNTNNLGSSSCSLPSRTHFVNTTIGKAFYLSTPALLDQSHRKLTTLDIINTPTLIDKSERDLVVVSHFVDFSEL